MVYGKNRIRRNYSRVQTVVELPNLLDIQTKSFDWFKNEGIKQLFKEISPIRDYSGKLELYFGDYEFDTPKYDIQKAKKNDANYSCPLKVDIQLKNLETGEIKEKQKVFLGEYPVMTPYGTFIINGAERVIVTQIVRSAGVFYSKEVDKKSGQVLYAGQVIPTRGAWIEYEIGKKDVLYAKLNRSNRVPITTFLSAIGINKRKDIVNLFGQHKFFPQTFDAEQSMGTDDAIRHLYDKLKPGENFQIDGARNYIAGLLLDNRRYDLASVGRYKVNKKLDCLARVKPLIDKAYYIFKKDNEGNDKDIISDKTGEVLIGRDEQTG